MRIMLVDDNRDALLVLESFLRTLDHRVSAYTDGTEALLWLSDERPQVIICDLDMPNMDGYTFVRNVRGRSSYASMPIICLTGMNDSDEHVLSQGFASILRKPTTLADLIIAIEQVTVEKSVVD